MHDIRWTPDADDSHFVSLCLAFSCIFLNNCLKFAKCIFWLQIFLFGKRCQELSASKDFSPFLANLPKTSEGVIDPFLVLILNNSFPSALFFLLLTSNKSYFFQVPAPCQHQHHSQYELPVPLCSTKTLFFVVVFFY